MDNNLNKCATPSFKGGNKSNNENEIKSPKKKQLPTKSFMNPTISAANKASVPKKKILGERNETVDPLEQISLQRSYSFGSKPVRSPVVVDSDDDDDVEKDVGGKSCLQPYDPVKNYLSPRPKFLRYNPNRRRKMLNVQESDEDRVIISADFVAGGNSELQDSCSGQESVVEAQESNSEEDEDETDEECEGEDDEDEMVEFGENRCCSVKGFFKFVFVVIALILTTQAICSMNSPPSASQTVESVWGFNHSLNHVYGLSLSEVGYGSIRGPDVLVERLKEGDVYDGYGKLDVSATSEEVVEAQFAKTDDYVHQDEILQEDEVEAEASEVVETDYVEAETVDDFNQDGVTEEDESDANDEIFQEDVIKAVEVEDTECVEAETVDDFSQDGDDSKANEMIHQLANDAAFETANDMEDGVEKELDDAKTDDVLIKSTSFDLTIAILIGSMLVLTSFGAIYRSRCKKVEKEEFKDLEPSTNPEPVTEEEQLVTNEASLHVPPQQNDVTKEISHVHVPSVELLGEFVFGEETTSTMSPVTIQTTAVSSSQTEFSHTVKKQRRKNAEVVMPSPVSVRRSSRLKTRSSVMSP